MTDDKTREDQRRSTVDVIAELDNEAKSHRVTVLLVGFDSSTLTISANNPDRLETLNECVQQGGEPMGFVCLDDDGDDMVLRARLIQEHADEEGAYKYLWRYMESFAETAEQAAILVPALNRAQISPQDSI